MYAINTPHDQIMLKDHFDLRFAVIRQLYQFQNPPAASATSMNKISLAR